MRLPFIKQLKKQQETGQLPVACPWCGKKVAFKFEHTHDTVATTKTTTKLVRLDKVPV